MGLFGFLNSSNSSAVNPVQDHHHPQQEGDSDSGIEIAQDDDHHHPVLPKRAMPILTPPMQLDSDEDKQSNSNNNNNTSGFSIGRVLDLFKGVGSDLSRFQVPVHFNLPKSQLQLYGELVYCFNQDLLAQCADAPTPIQRFIAVLRWHIASTRPAHFGKAPFNPVLGETHHVSAGDLNVFLEQVSHHPPISALHATNEKKGIQLHFCHQAFPKFYGSGVEVTIHGRRFLKLSQHDGDGDEIYEMSSPKLGFRFLPVPGVDWSGVTTVSCDRTGLKACVAFKNKALFGLHGSSRRISGKVWDSATGQTLYEIQGNWDQLVFLKNKATGATTTLFDARAELTNLKTPEVRNLNAVSPMESALVWSSVSEALLARDTDRARAAKNSIEEQQRAIRRDRSAAGLSWSPKFFAISPTSGEWEWQSPDQPVPEAPIVVPVS